MGSPKFSGFSPERVLGATVTVGMAKTFSAQGQVMIGTAIPVTMASYQVAPARASRHH